jgi:hypothetical protein
MGGIYGGFLEAFAELYRRIKFYEQENMETAGYKNRKEVGTFIVIFQSDRGNGFSGPAGRLSYNALWKTLDTTNHDYMFSVKKIPIGTFFHHPERDNQVYRLAREFGFNAEGGFYEWGIERVTGDTGEHVDKLSKKVGVY